MSETMDVPRYIDHVRSAARRFGEAVDGVALGSAVPSCPEWQVRDLVHHMGYVHRWAALHLRERPAEVVKRPVRELFGEPPPDRELRSWYREGHETLVSELREAPADLACGTFLAAPSPLRMWARRQAHETMIHRVDAELVVGEPTTIDASLAADGIDELLTCFLTRPGRGPRHDQPATVVVAPTDTATRWKVQLSDGDTEVARIEDAARAADDPTSGAGDARPWVRLRGPSAALYLLLWNRADRRELAERGELLIDGEEALADEWRALVQIRSR